MASAAQGGGPAAGDAARALPPLVQALLRRFAGDLVRREPCDRARWQAALAEEEARDDP
ncbi:MAG: hypothetical protein N3B15_07655 [Planctomycetota bacterium]|nr:hypothetical protein [Planctomycetota bacterium]MCX8040427.1 hypothetical protein [Planctomycetota bacterium]